MLLNKFVENIRYLTVCQVQRNAAKHYFVIFNSKHKTYALKEGLQLCYHLQFVCRKGKLVREHQLLTGSVHPLQTLYKSLVQHALVSPVAVDDNQFAPQSSDEVFFSQTDDFLALRLSRFSLEERAFYRLSSRIDSRLDTGIQAFPLGGFLLKTEAIAAPTTAALYRRRFHLKRIEVGVYLYFRERRLFILVLIRDIESGVFSKIEGRSNAKLPQTVLYSRF